MNPLIVFSAIVFAPVILALLLRVNSVLLFVAVSAGMLLQQSIGAMAVLVVSGFLPAIQDVVVDIALIALPVVTMLWLLRGSAKRSAVAMQLVPLVLVGFVLGYSLLAVMPGDFAIALYETPIGTTIDQAKDLLMGLAAVVHIVVAWLLYRHKHTEKHGKH